MKSGNNFLVSSALITCMCTRYYFFAGEPNCPISTGVRGRQKAIVPREGPSLSALDHDFHVAGITPSVVFLSTIPSSIDETFFSGNISVITKDKAFQPSSPMRHARELERVIEDKYDDKYPPILFMYSDGGPDHRLTLLLCVSFCG